MSQHLRYAYVMIQGLLFMLLATAVEFCFLPAKKLRKMPLSLHELFFNICVTLLKYLLLSKKHLIQYSTGQYVIDVISSTYLTQVYHKNVVFPFNLCSVISV